MWKRVRVHSWIVILVAIVIVVLYFCVYLALRAQDVLIYRNGVGIPEGWAVKSQSDRLNSMFKPVRLMEESIRKAVGR